MAAKTRNISTLIESQLPGFIISDYEKFKVLIEKYYEQLELRGQPLDILHNITKYRDLDFYDKNILTEKTILVSNISSDSTTITVADASSFPEENGYIKINEEICFYKSRTNTQFLEVSRGVSGNTTLGDLYNSSEFVSTESTSHSSSSVVYNLSNLFLYAFVRNIENEYLGAFPEKYLKGEIDKRTLIKNISSFYKAKGTDRSIQFLFRTVISKNPQEQISVYNPKDYTIKPSTSDWDTKTVLRVLVISGDITKLVGSEIKQETSDNIASAIIDNIKPVGVIDDYQAWEITLSPGSLLGDFLIAAATDLKKQVTVNDNVGDRITVFSTQGFEKRGNLLIDGVRFSYSDKTVNQFIINKRFVENTIHDPGTKVFNFTTINGIHDQGEVVLLPLGIVYNLLPVNKSPYSSTGDKIQIGDGGFDSDNPIVFNASNNSYRWLLNSTYEEVDSVFPNITDKLKDVLADVSAVYEDDQYFYICSSSYPSNNFLLTNKINKDLQDQKLLKLIRKTPITTTEIYQTGNRDIGILVDGSPVFSFRDFDSISYGNITDIKITNKGFGYLNPPYVLVNEEPGKARATLLGEVLGDVELLEDAVYTKDPSIRITSGEGAKLTAVVTNGEITSIKIDSPGKYYSTAPIIRIIDLLGRGSFAEYTAVVSDGKIVELQKINGGKFYQSQYTKVIVEPVGSGAIVEAKIKRWVKNRYISLQKDLDDNNGYVFENVNTSRGYGYGVVSNPVVLRRRLSDSITSTYQESATLAHSPIIGFAYDGNPIYGPYGYENPFDPTSPITRLKSGYKLKSKRTNGPSIVTYPLGSFVDDYEWVASVNSEKTELGINNGRYCVTPDYPNGVYAYFLTIDVDNNPVFPYFLGPDFYSLPVDSNYNSPISQDDLPKNIKRLKTSDFDDNGSKFFAVINDVTSGNISNAIVESSPNNFSVGNKVILNEFGTSGSGAEIAVGSVNGKEVISLESRQTKAVKIKTIQTSYLFEGDTIQQGSVTGELIGNVFNGNEFVLRDVSGEFNLTNTISSSTKVEKFILDKDTIYTKGATILFVNKDTNDIEATGEILESVNKQNSVTVKILTGSFVVSDEYFLKSSVLSDTSRSEIVSITSLSENLNIFEIVDNIAIVETQEDHNITKGDFVDIDVIPDSATTETTYYVRKRAYQTLYLNDIVHDSKIIDTGVGSLDILNTGDSYISGTYADVELIFQDVNKARNNIGRVGDSGNARARITVSNPNGNGIGSIQSVVITDKGSGYRREDVLTISEASITIIDPTTTQRFAASVSHVGFSNTNTTLSLTNVTNLSIDDYIKVGSEILKITAVKPKDKAVTVLRGQKGTRPENHFNDSSVSMEESSYKLDVNYRPLGSNYGQPFIKSYDPINKEITVTYDYGASIEQIQEIIRSSIFFDQSIPAKLVSLNNVTDVKFKLEFSKGDETNFVINPSLEIQKFYGYKFDTSHFSMANTYLDVSASINYNISSQEKIVSSISPGSPGSFVFLKFGFGPTIVGQGTPERINLNYNTYYYFIRSSDINTDGAKLNVVNDPLVGSKKIIYNTDKKFVYLLDSVPEYDGSGEITYTTTSPSAVGSINTLKIINKGLSYNVLPTSYGVVPIKEFEASVTAEIDTKTKTLSSIVVDTSGTNYVNPVAIITDSDGSGGLLKCFFNQNGEITSVKILEKGSNYTFATVKIVEADAKVYLESDNIGIAKNVSFFTNGSWFNRDLTTRPSFKSPTTFVLKNIGNFSPSKIITQPSTGATAELVSWRNGGNLLKVENIRGVFKNNKPIFSSYNNTSAILVAQISSEFNAELRSFNDNIGSYQSPKGRLGEDTQRIQDSYFYQDYSYVIESETPVNQWRDLIKQTTHPAGFELFGEINVFSDGKAPMPAQSQTIETFCQLNLRVQAIDTITTSRVITTSVLKYDSFAIEKGAGAISITDVDLTETRIEDFVLYPEFDGDLDPDTSKRIGTKQFTILNSQTGLPFSPYNNQQLIVALDGILQEPGVSFNVSGNQIIFNEAPLGERVAEGQIVPAQKFYGKSIRFRDNTLNDVFLRKIEDISKQFNNRTKEFDLYYENGDIVKSDLDENLIVVIDGVKQKFGKKNSYTIIRSSNPQVTDKISFREAPVKQDIVYSTTEDLSIEVFQKSFIYSVGNYFTATIDTSAIRNRPNGPFLIRNEATQQVINVTDPLYALVFVDNILQIPEKSYNISGSIITFNSPLPLYIDEEDNLTLPKVEILYVFGKNIEKTLTIHNFEADAYFRRVTLQVNGPQDKTSITRWIDESNPIIGGDPVSNLFYASLVDRGVMYDLLVDPVYTATPGFRYGRSNRYPNVPLFNIPTQTFNVTVIPASPTDLAFNLYVIDGVVLPQLTLTPGNTYRFNVSDPSCANFPLAFETYSPDILENIPLNPTYFQVVRSKNQGETGAFVDLIIKPDAPIDSLITYYCENDLYQFNTITLEDGPIGQYGHGIAAFLEVINGRILKSTVTSFGSGYKNNDVVNAPNFKGSLNIGAGFSILITGQDVETYDDGGNDLILGEISAYYFTNNELTLILKSKVNWDLPEGPKMLKLYKRFDGNVFGKVLDGTYTITATDVEDSDGIRQLRRNTTYWLDGDRDDRAYYNRNKIFNNLQPSDKIKVSGEQSYREIINIPRLAYSKQFNHGQPIDRDIYTKITTTSYNGPISGVGFSIVAKIDNLGRVIDLDWNKPEFTNYYNFIKRSSSTYGYVDPPQIYFVPKSQAGGGAQAKVIWEKDVVDIVITNPGYGYEEAPIVVVAKPYDIIKNPNRKIDSLSIVGVQPKIQPKLESAISIVIQVPVGLLDAVSFFTGANAGIVKEEKVITTFVEPDQQIVTLSDFVYFTYNVTYDFTRGGRTYLVDLQDVDSHIIYREIQPQITSFVEFYSSEVEFEYQIVANNALLLPGVTTSDWGTILDADFLIGDTIMYVTSTRGFPSSGRLLVGYEIIYYGSKEADRFLEITRGEYNTLISNHFAGDYVRYTADLIFAPPVYPDILVENVEDVSLVSVVSRLDKFRALRVPPADITLDVDKLQLRIESEIYRIETLDSVLEIDSSYYKEKQVYLERILDSVIDVDFEYVKIKPSDYEASAILVDVDDSFVRYIQPERELDYIVSIEYKCDVIKTLDPQLFLGDYTQSSEITLIINPVETVTISGVFTDVFGPLDVDVEATTDRFFVLEIDPSIISIELSYYKEKPIQIERNASFTVDNFEKLLTREYQLQRNIPLDVIFSVEIDVPIREDIGEGYAIATFPPIDQLAFFRQPFKEYFTAFGEEPLAGMSDEVRHPWFLEIQPQVFYDINIIKEITFFYPNFHLDPITQQPSEKEGLYGIVTMSATYPIEVFFSRTIPAPPDFGGDDINDLQIIPRLAGIENVVIDIERTVESLVSNLNTSISKEITVYHPTNEEQGTFFAQALVVGIFTNFNDFENLPDPLFPYLGPVENIVFTRVLDLSSTIDVVDITSIIKSNGFVGENTQAFVQEIITSYTSDGSEVSLIDTETQINILVTSIPENTGETARISDEVAERLFVQQIVTGIVDSIANEFSNKYTRTTLGPTYRQFESNAFISNGTLNVNASMSYLLDRFVIEEFELRKESSVSADGIPFNLAIPTINELGAILENDLLTTDTEMTLVTSNGSISSTWPTSGQLLVGNELIEYTGISGNTLTGLIRGVNGTQIQIHTAGDYLRTIG